MTKTNDWLSLMIGNSRLHWAWFKGLELQSAWDSEYLFPPQIPQPLPLYIASVVPEQTYLWQQAYPDSIIITLNDLCLKGIYPTLGIDRALAVLGAIEVWGYPCLVIDGGTALTFTGVDSNRELVGGAILPGLKLQLQSLAKNTAALPDITLSSQQPPRWAKNTPEAISSGVIYGLVATIQDYINDWCVNFGASQIILTGGDATFFLSYLKTQSAVIDPYLIFWGIRRSRGAGE